MKDIEEVVEIFKMENCQFELMHCISAYPFDDSLANLNLIKIYKEKFNCKVGYSGHEKGGLAISYAAAALGITSLERHFTLDRTMYGSDQSASLEPSAFKDLIGGVRKIEKAINGSNIKKILDIEVEIAKKLRRHIKN
jgi:N-acetylneuraminate synthase